MSELAADGIPVAVTCRVLKLARQPYYRWLSTPVTDTEIIEAYRANALFDAHEDDPEFGYRFLVEEARTAGEAMAERTAWRICSQHRLWSVFGKKRGKNGKVGPPVHDDLVEREPRGEVDVERTFGAPPGECLQTVAVGTDGDALRAHPRPGSAWWSGRPPRAPGPARPGSPAPRPRWPQR